MAEYIVDDIRYLDHNDKEVILMEILSEKKFCKLSIPAIIHNKIVTKINNYAFFNRLDLEEVSIPATIYEIGGLAFAGCQNLKSIIIRTPSQPLQNLIIREEAFVNCFALTEFIGRSRIVAVLDNAFVRCGALRLFDTHIAAIGFNAFGGCNSLKTLFLNENASLQRGALNDCSVAKLVFDGDGFLDEALLREIWVRKIAITCPASSNLADLVYDGFVVKAVKK